MTIDIGSIVAGYRLYEAVGSGPFGRVYRAMDAVGASFAVKLLKPSFLGRADGRNAFSRLEASVAVHTRLVHPNLARIYGPVVDPAAGAFGQIVEDLRGRTVRPGDLDPGTTSGRDPVGLARVLGWFEQLGELLHWLHGQGMVHGNLKPTNLLLLRYGHEDHVKLLDLSWSAIGVAAISPGPESYVSPEQYDGQVPTALSDQWALATLLERLLTGGRRRLALGILPAPLVQAVQRATQADPRARFEGVKELVDQLRDIRVELQRTAGEVEPDPQGGTLPGGKVPEGLLRPAQPTTRPAEDTLSGDAPSFRQNAPDEPTQPGEAPIFAPRARNWAEGKTEGEDEGESGGIRVPSARTVQHRSTVTMDPVPRPPPSVVRAEGNRGAEVPDPALAKAESSSAESPRQTLDGEGASSVGASPPVDTSTWSSSQPQTLGARHDPSLGPGHGLPEPKLAPRPEPQVIEDHAEAAPTERPGPLSNPSISDLAMPPAGSHEDTERIVKPPLPGLQPSDPALGGSTEAGGAEKPYGAHPSISFNEPSVPTSEIHIAPGSPVLSYAEGAQQAPAPRIALGFASFAALLVMVAAIGFGAFRFATNPDGDRFISELGLSNPVVDWIGGTSTSTSASSASGEEAGAVSTSSVAEGAL